MAWGCFDLFHEGHEHFLRQCLGECSYLVVAVNSDASVRALKGEGRPRDQLGRRMREVREFLDRVSRYGPSRSGAVIPFDGYEEGLIVHIRPDVIFRGYDHTLDVSRGTCQVAKGVGCAIVQIEHLPGYSTTELIHAAQ